MASRRVGRTPAERGSLVLEIDRFAREVRRLRDEAEPTLYPAYVSLVASSYATDVYVDTNRHTPGTGFFPDLTVARDVLCLNWIEIKSPDVSIDPLPTLDHERFERYRKTLPHVVLTNGCAWRLFERGELTERLDLPAGWLLGSESLGTQDRHRLVTFLRRCAALAPTSATTADEAINLLANAANVIRLAVEGVDEADYPVPLRTARESFTNLLRTNPAETAPYGRKEFADALAQTTVFGFLLGRIEAGEAVDPHTAHAALNTIEHPFLKNSLYALNAPDRDMEAILKGGLRAACDMVNRAAPQLAGDDGNWTRVTYVYEDFFARYRPEDRFKYGVFYTDMAITRYQVREVARVLRDEFGLSGITDPSARFLEPACGTGTYLLALAELAAEEAAAQGMPIGTTLKDMFAERVVGFEVSPGPACVAQARLSAWLRSPPYNVSLGGRFPIYTVNTLTPPAKGLRELTGNMWSDSIGAEQEAGDKVKASSPVLVVLGNPPWGRRDKREFDISGAVGLTGTRNLLEDWAKGAAGAAQSVYDLYVAFWRFSCSLLLERQDVQPPRGVISFITNRTWLRGSPFTTMRKYMRARGVRALTTDLGGDSRLDEVTNDECVFSIQAGCAVSTLSFGGATAGTETRFRRLYGKREEKLAQLSEAPAWETGPNGQTDPFAPVDWGGLGKSRPAHEFFIRHLPGVKTHRDPLVVGLDRDQVLKQIEHWSELGRAERARVFHATDDMGVPAAHEPSAKHVKVYRYRPLDDRAIYAAPGFVDRPGTISKTYAKEPHARHLLCLPSATVSGPVVIATNTLPDYHSVRGSYGSHAMLLDSVSSGDDRQLPMPGVDDGLTVLSHWAAAWARTMGASPLDVGCYLLALGNAQSYVERFHDAVQIEAPRMPATLDRTIFREAVEIGQRLLEAWCLQATPAGTWQQRSSPHTKLGKPSFGSGEIVFENGDRLTGLHRDAAEFVVSSYPVLARFFEDRADSPLTRTLASEARKVVGAISVILDERAACDGLLRRALNARMLEPKPIAKTKKHAVAEEARPRTATRGRG